MTTRGTKTLDIAQVAADTRDPPAGLRAIVSLRALVERLEPAQVEAVREAVAAGGGALCHFQAALSYPGCSVVSRLLWPLQRLYF